MTTTETCQLNDFNWLNACNSILGKIQKGDIVVQVGAGNNTACYYAAQYLEHRELNAFWILVDPWKGPPNSVFCRPQEISDYNLYYRFLQKLSESKTLHRLIPLLLTSLEASTLFDNKTIYAVWLNTVETENDMFSAIGAWWPKIQPHGWLGGNNYNSLYPGVIKAVDHFFPCPDAINNGWWLTKKLE